jgi:hypothetical protein
VELTSQDYKRAANLGMDHEEDAEHSGKKLRTMHANQLWGAIMGSARREDYPYDAVSQLRSAYDGGRSDYH